MESDVRSCLTLLGSFCLTGFPEKRFREDASTSELIRNVVPLGGMMTDLLLSLFEGYKTVQSRQRSDKSIRGCRVGR